MIQTVTGPVCDSTYTKILMHEHIRCASNDMLQTFGNEWLDNNFLIEYSSKILLSLKEKYNVGMIVDGTPIDSGRDIRTLEKISQKSGVKIVASTGLYSFQSMITVNRDEDEIASWFIKEFESGIEGTNIKPGILKCACDDCGITLDNAK